MAKTKLFKLMTIFMLFTVVSTTTFSVISSFGSNNVVLAQTGDDDKKDDKKDDESKDDKDKDKEDESSEKDSSSSSSDSGNEKSPWNDAIQQLAENAGYESNNKKVDSDDAKDSDMARIDDVGVGTPEKYMNAWSFMGPGNKVFWEKSTNSTWSTSYDKLVEATSRDEASGTYKDVVIPRFNAYKQATRFAYAVQMSGLDRTSDSTTDDSTSSTLNSAIGNLMQLSYVVMSSIEGLFKLSLDMLKNINPVNWARFGTAQISIFNPVAEVVHEAYVAFSDLGIGIIGMLFAGSLALAGMGVTVGTGNNAFVGPGKAIINTFVNLLKRFFVYIWVPVFGGFMFAYIVDSAQNMFESTDSSVPNYAVFGSFVDYQKWIMNSRMALPSGVTLNASFDSNKVLPISHKDIVAINRDSAGYTKLGALSTNNESAINVKQNDESNNSLSDNAKHLLSVWSSGDSITAADYASAMDGWIMKQVSKSNDKSDDKDSKASDSDLVSELVKREYNANAGNSVSGDNNEAKITGPGKTYTGLLNSNDNGGLSTVGMYVYLLATASKSNLYVTNTENLSTTVTLPKHASVILVGNGAEGTGKLIWSFGMMLSLAILTIGYVWEVLKAIVLSIPNLSIGTILAGLGSQRLGVRLIAMLLGLLITVWGSAVLYVIVNKAIIAVAISMNQGLESFMVSSISMFGGYDGSAGMLASNTTLRMSQTAFDIFYGIFLIWLALQFLKIRSVFVTGVTSLIEESINKVMYTMGLLSGQGSGGTHGSLMESVSSNVNNSSVSSMLGTAGKYATMGALGAGGLAGAKDLLKSGADKSSGKNDSKEKEKSDSKSNNNNKTAMSQLGNKSSANKVGNASDRVGQGKSDQNGNGLSNLSNDKSDKDLSSAPVMDDQGNQVGTTDSDNLSNMDNQYGDSIGMNDNMDSNSMQDGDMYQGDVDNNDMNQGDELSNQDSMYDAQGDQVDGSDMNNDQYGDSIGMNEDSTMNDMGTSQESNAFGDTDDSQSNMNQNDLNSDSLNQMGDTSNSDMSNSSTDSISDSLNQQRMDADRALNGDSASGQISNDMSSGDSIGMSDNSTGGMTLGDSSLDADNSMQSGGSLDSANSSLHVPVDNSLSSTDISSQMGDIQNASESARNAMDMSQSNPSNKTLKSEASMASQQLQGLQSNVMSDYNAQPVGNNDLQSNWMSNNIDKSNVSVGTANNAMNNVYSAQNNLAQAQSRYGADSSQVRQAQQDLNTARNDAVKSGLDSKFVGDTKAVSNAHNALKSETNSLMNGSWRPSATSSNNLGSSARRNTIGM